MSDQPTAAAASPNAEDGASDRPDEPTGPARGIPADMIERLSPEAYLVAPPVRSEPDGEDARGAG
jgi:hypothetical protein